MEGSLKVTGPWNSWHRRVLKSHRTMECLGKEGPKRSQKHAMVGVGGFLMVTESWHCRDGRVLKGHRAMELLG